MGQENIWEHVPLAWKNRIESLIKREGTTRMSDTQLEEMSGGITYHMDIGLNDTIGDRSLSMILCAVDDSGKPFNDKGLCQRTRDFVFQFLHEVFGSTACTESTAAGYRLLVGYSRNSYWLAEVKNSDTQVVLLMYRYTSKQRLLSDVVESRHDVVSLMVNRFNSGQDRVVEGPRVSGTTACICQRCNKQIVI
jgi:hypothetical protein